MKESWKNLKETEITTYERSKQISIFSAKPFCMSVSKDDSKIFKRLSHFLF